jgi:dCTP diphosphatase
MTNTTLAGLTQRVLQFRDERHWKQFQNAKDVALPLVLEAAEVLELMQWKEGDDLEKSLQEEKRRLGEELAHVLYWVLILAHDRGIDLADAFAKKMAANAAKYPVEKARGVSTKYDEL